MWNIGLEFFYRQHNAGSADGNRLNSKSPLLKRSGLCTITNAEECSLFVFEAADVYRTQSFWSFFNFKFYFFSIFESLVVAQILYVVSVDKNIFAAFLRFNESVTFLGIEPFYFTLLHNKYSSCFVTIRDLKK